MFQLVRFSCGCIGTKPVDGISTVINSCDGEGDRSFYQRGMEGTDGPKPFEPLSDEETEKFRGDIEKLIYDGYSLRTVRSALGVQIKKLLE